MEQIFIEVSARDKKMYNQDIKNSNAVERAAWYKTLTKTKLIELLEKVGKFDENR